MWAEFLGALCEGGAILRGGVAALIAKQVYGTMVPVSRYRGPFFNFAAGTLEACARGRVVAGLASHSESKGE